MGELSTDLGALAPGLRALVTRAERPLTSLWVPAGLRSVRGIETLRDLEVLSVPSHVRLDAVARLPRLRKLSLEGRRTLRRAVHLGPLAAAAGLEELALHTGVRAEGLAALAVLPALRVLMLCYVPSPDLRPVAGLPLRRLELDGVRGVRLRDLEGLGVEQLDLWGCGLSDLAPLATMPNLREVWLNGNPVRSLRPLMHLGEGARVFLDGDLDPELHRQDLAELEARGVWLLVTHSPHDHGHWPSWWGGGPSSDEDREPIRYVSGPG